MLGCLDTVFSARSFELSDTNSVYFTITLFTLRCLRSDHLETIPAGHVSMFEVKEELEMTCAVLEVVDTQSQ